MQKSRGLFHDRLRVHETLPLVRNLNESLLYRSIETINIFLCYLIGMSKTSKALRQLPPATLGALQKLGADLAVARLRRKESLRTWAKRLGVSLSTLQRLEAGDPTLSIGIIASALWLINRDGELANLAAPEHDQGALELDIREAVELGQARAQASADARLRAATPNRSKKD
jgi:hypothetical protein